MKLALQTTVELDKFRLNFSRCSNHDVAGFSNTPSLLSAHLVQDGGNHDVGEEERKPFCKYRQIRYFFQSMLTKNSFTGK